MPLRNSSGLKPFRPRCDFTGEYGAPQAYWAFSEGSGLSIRDYGPAGVPLTAITGITADPPVWALSDSGRCLNFAQPSTSDQYASAPISYFLTNVITTDFTWLIKFKLSRDSSAQCVMARGATGNVGKLYAAASNKLNFYVGSNFYAGTTTLAAGHWYTVLVSMTGPIYTIVMNGGLEVTGTTVSSAKVTANDGTSFFLFRDSAGSDQWTQGLLDVAAVWPYSMPLNSLINLSIDPYAPIRAHAGLTKAATASSTPNHFPRSTGSGGSLGGIACGIRTGGRL